jgi:hypothetical protein
VVGLAIEDGDDFVQLFAAAAEQLHVVFRELDDAVY